MANYNYNLNAKKNKTKMETNRNNFSIQKSFIKRYVVILFVQQSCNNPSAFAIIRRNVHTHIILVYKNKPGNQSSISPGILLCVHCIYTQTKQITSV